MYFQDAKEVNVNVKLHKLEKNTWAYGQRRTCLAQKQWKNQEGKEQLI